MQIHILPSGFAGEPEAVAMLQAYYSRSTESINSRLKKLDFDVKKVKDALKRVYIGYGHNSVADCGTVTFFVEGVSILAAKAIQEDPLYNGQECSTRYIRLTGELYEHNEYADQWMNIQRDVLAMLTTGVRDEHTFTEPVNDHASKEFKQWENATAARAFDIARAWIPTSALTNLSVHMTLRKVNEMTARLAGHPLQEVRNIASALREACVKHYPDASQEFTVSELRLAMWLMEDLSLWYMNPNGSVAPAIRATRLNAQGGVEPQAMSVFVENKVSAADALFINRRPRHAPLPQHFQSKANFTLNGFMDYATWRDIQRHRRQIGAPPMVTAEFGMNQWYYDQVNRYLHASDASSIIHRTEALLRKLEVREVSEAVNDQYKMPIGVNVPFEYKFGLSQAFYLAELRSGNTVHAILRPYAQKVAEQLENCGLRVDYDKEPARFDLKRGLQTITESA